MATRIQHTATHNVAIGLRAANDLQTIHQQLLDEDGYPTQ